MTGLADMVFNKGAGVVIVLITVPAMTGTSPIGSGVTAKGETTRKSPLKMWSGVWVEDVPVVDAYDLEAAERPWPRQGYEGPSVVISGGLCLKGLPHCQPL